MIVPIASVEDGARARISGTVRRAKEALSSSITKKPCVYWDVRRGLSADPIRQEASDFWLEDASGRALIIVEKIAVDARADRQQEVLRVADADHAAVEKRIREIKDLLKTTAGPKAGELHRERNELGHVATLLCAIRAHARGRIHLGGSLGAQERWIHENAEASGKDKASVKLMIDSWEVVIEEGQQVEVEGLCAVEPIPPGVGAGGGYRDRPTCLVVRADGDHLRVTGVGASAPVRPQDREIVAGERSYWEDGHRVRVVAPTFGQIVIGVLAIILSVAVILTLLLE